jgi:hypothetical protein
VGRLAITKAPSRLYPSNHSLFGCRYDRSCDNLDRFPGYLLARYIGRTRRAVEPSSCGAIARRRALPQEEAVMADHSSLTM